MPRRLVLLATTEPWKLSYAEEEIGNALYLHDESVEVRRDEKYPLLYVFSRRLSAREAFQLVVREPPAYVERIIPVDVVVRDVFSCEQSQASSRRFLEFIVEFTQRKVNGSSVNVEVKARRYFIMCSDKEALGSIRSFLAAVGFKVSRRAGRTVKIEDTAYGVVLAVLPTGWDRVRFWREKRLGMHIA